jgi:hypothetical protein
MHKSPIRSLVISHCSEGLIARTAVHCSIDSPRIAFGLTSPFLAVSDAGRTKQVQSPKYCRKCWKRLISSSKAL